MSDQLREPPHNDELECALLGALLYAPATYDRISDLTDPNHFYTPAHVLIYTAISELMNQNRDATPLMVAEHLGGKLESVGGKRYLFELSTAIISVREIRHYAESVRDLALRRAMIPLFHTAIEDAYAPLNGEINTTITSRIDSLESELFQLTHLQHEGELRPWASVIDEAMNEASVAAKRQGSVVGVPTGLSDLDAMLGGLQPSDLIILAGRPGMGKSALAVHIAEVAAINASKVAIFSLEMSGSQLAQRRMGARSGISADLIRRGETGDEAIGQVAQAGQELRALPIYVDDTAALPLAQIKSRSRRQARRTGVDLIIVDHLQRIAGSSQGRRYANRVSEVGETSRGLKDLAKAMNCPVIAVSQLSRNVEARDDKRPMLSDLRESGDIEQDADIVAFLYRDSYYLQKVEPRQKGSENDQRFSDRYMSWQADVAESENLLDLIVSKNRHGPTGSISCFFDVRLGRFADFQKT